VIADNLVQVYSFINVTSYKGDDVIKTFARILKAGTVIPVIVVEETYLDLRLLVADITPEVIASGLLTKVDTTGLSPVDGDFTHEAPITGIRQIVATGFTYKQHIAEMHVPMPTEPEVFLKSMLSQTGPVTPIRRGPNPGVKLDWETALAIVIGRPTEHVSKAEAADHIFGYVILDDIFDRSTQVDAAKQQHLVRAKSRATYSPIGPFLVTGIDPGTLDVWTKLNGDYEQQGNTSHMLFDVYDLLCYFSRYLPMVPGDLLATGTPPGVGMGKNKFMAVGHVMECGITHLGTQRHDIVP
jgi:2-keto-4-pentenoate hydratase/2-oxohepta-3-ene-1,7-dioic acid hydratase in catechol pathway